MSSPSPAVLAVLAASQEAGFLGPGPVEEQARLADAFLLAAPAAPTRALDLGSGGGLPGLVLAEAWAGAEVVLLDRGTRRCAFLRRAVVELGWDGRVTVVEEEAEVAGRGLLRGVMDVVVARSFGPPAVTAECGAPFLRPGGHLLVAEPPLPDPGRWPDPGLATLGLERGAVVAAPARVQVLALHAAVPDRYPRRPGIPAKRPLW